MKKLMLIILALFILSLTISTLQATQVNLTDSCSSQNSVSEKTFDAIQQTINDSAQSDTILLEGSYSGSGKAVTVDKSITLKGTGNARLNANSKSLILDVKADNVTIENIEFFNGYSYDNGGGIRIEGSNIRIINCNFTSNYVKMYGGGILSDGDNVSVVNCRFTKNTAEYTGGAMELDGDNNYVENCIFTNNIGGHVGGSIAWTGDNGVLKDSVFQNTVSPNVPSQYGGAVVWIGANGMIESSIFSYNEAKISGAAVYWRGENGTLKNSIFTNNTSPNDAAYCGNPDNIKNNYWGVNINTADEFIEGKLIYYDGNFSAPENWVNLIIGGDAADFKLNDGKTLNESLPDYEITVNGVNIVLSANHYKFKKNTELLSSAMISYNNGEYLKVTLKDEDNRGIVNKYVQISINGKTYNVKTDEQGVAKLKLKTLNPKSYYAAIRFNGDDDYKSSTKTVKLTVKKQKTTVKVAVSGKKKTVKVTLKNQFKKALSKKTVKLTVGKKTYKLKTTKKGTATFKLKLKKGGKYKYSVKFPGDKYYKKIIKKGFIRVL